MFQSLKLPLLLAAVPLCASFVPCPISTRTLSITSSGLGAARWEEGPVDSETPPPMTTTTTTTTTRRDVLLSAAAASLAAVAQSIIPATANAEETTAAPISPAVKSIATLNVSIARGPSRPLRIELFRDAPPASSDFFASLVDGDMKAPCAMGDNPNIEICEEYQDIRVGYKNSQLWRLVPDKRMDFGRVDSMFASRIAPSIAEAEEDGEIVVVGVVRPSTRGAVSIKRGGGAFEFTVAPKYNPSLDGEREDLVVVGRIVEEDLPFVDEINAVPVRRDIVRMGDVPPLGAKFARACDFTAPDSTCAQYKPLKKIIVTEASRTDAL